LPKRSNSIRVPALVHHKPSGQGCVRIAGRDFYLGEYGKPETEERYRRMVAEHIANGSGVIPTPISAPPTPEEPAPALLVSELILAFYRYAETYYVKNGEPTSELRMIRDALRMVKEFYGSTPAEEFGPIRLKTVRSEMIRRRWCRREINKKIGRIRRMFSWGVENEKIKAIHMESLRSIKGLRQGRTKAKESEPVRPVEQERINAVLPHVPRQVRDMIRLQLLTGCRPGEICIMRPCDVNQDGEIWEYVPSSFKTEHHEGKQRIIFIGPKAQEILRPWLDDRPTEAFCFSPAEAREERFASMRRKRRSKVPPSQKNRRKRNLKRKPRDKFTAATYGKAVLLGCEKAVGMPREWGWIPKETPEGFTDAEWQAERERRQQPAAEWRKEHGWSPNQLRHSRATYLRKTYGVEGSQVILGHAKADVTQIYAERDIAKARVKTV
jgi:integrase